jgi:hypothetical protein
MIDIVDITTDMQTLNSSIKKAENLLAVQLGSLSYAPEWGIDLEYFLSEDFSFQNESFRAYLLQRLAENSIDVTSVIETVDALYSSLVFNLSSETKTTAMMR